MLTYIARRLLGLPLLLIFVSLMVFSLMHIAPGDPVLVILGDYYTPEGKAAITHELGLDRPLPVQYASWIWNAAHGDLGKSVANGQKVLREIAVRIPNTLLLATMAMVWGVVTGIPLGIAAGVKQNTWIDYATMGFALGGISVPNFVLAIFLIFVLAIYLDLVPISGAPSVMDDPLEAVRLFILPGLALGTSTTGIVARTLRASMVEVMNQDFMLTARGKGLSRFRIYWHHALKNALIPTLTILGMNYAYMLGGSVVIEQIFSIPGIGAYMVDSVLLRDYPVIQGISLVVALIFIVANLVIDVLYSYVDPRIRYD
jgi:peptide/nickel transport system permease protein